jgi:hypothetical protein
MIVSAVGRKKSSAASTQRLMEDVPLWAAAAIQRGPRTAAMLKRRTSQNPIARRNWDFSLAGVSKVLLFGVKREDSRTRREEQKESARYWARLSITRWRDQKKLPELPGLPRLKIENLTPD